MANKQVSELSALDTVAGDDLIPIFDSTEAGDEKLKKYTVQELKTDLTSMDPSAFGNWVKLGDHTSSFSTATSDTFQSDISSESHIKMSVTINSVASATNLLVGAGDASSWEGSGEFVGTVNNRRILENWSGSATLDIIYDVEAKIFRVVGSQYNGSTSNNIDVSIKYTGSLDITRIFLQSYTTSEITVTGSIVFYKWQELKPIELHSYELVKEYNLDNETLDDTFDWDGEADPDCLILANIISTSNSSVSLTINGDTGNNYSYGGNYTDGTSVLGGYGTSLSAILLGAGGANRGMSHKFELYLKNNGNIRVGRRYDAAYFADNEDFLSATYGVRWHNTADDVTSLSLISAASLSGNIRIYKLAKAHLFNQTIYNDTTLNVATTGSDTTGDGTSQKPFASLQGALAWLDNKTVNNSKKVTIQFADGTYNNQEYKDFNLPCRLYIKGNIASPASVTLNFTSGTGWRINGPGKAVVVIQGLKMVGTGVAGHGIIFYQNVAAYLSNMIIDNFSNQISAVSGSNVTVSASTLNGGGLGVYTLQFGQIWATGCTISNNDYGAYASQKGDILLTSCTLTGNTQNTLTATGGTITTE